MGFTLMNQAVALTDYDYIESPVKAGLMGHNLLGGSLAQSLKNAVSDTAADLAAIGNPEIHPNWVSFAGGKDYLRSFLMQQPEHTLIFVARSLDALIDDASQPMFMSTFDGQNRDHPQFTTHGLSAYVEKSGAPAPQGKLFAGAGICPLATPANTSQKTQNIDFVDFSQFNLCVLRQSSTAIAIDSLTKGTASPMSAFSDGYGVALSTLPWCLGGPANPLKSKKGKCDMGYWAIYDRVLTMEEIAIIATWLRRYYRPLGINL
ncbi:TPA: hypothetical protein SMI16_004854 [Serratia liquefaciens]|nr:hypothetical protein [Serratia liquefaciens]